MCLHAVVTDLNQFNFLLVLLAFNQALYQLYLYKVSTLDFFLSCSRSYFTSLSAGQKETGPRGEKKS